MGMEMEKATMASLTRLIQSEPECEEVKNFLKAVQGQAMADAMAKMLETIKMMATADEKIVKADVKNAARQKEVMAALTELQQTHQGYGEDLQKIMDLVGKLAGTPTATPTVTAPSTTPPEKTDEEKKPTSKRKLGINLKGGKS